MDSQETKIYNAILIAVVVIGVIIAYFIISMLRQHKKVLMLQREKAAAEINALEKDRARIAADIHDDLSPVLSAVKMRINSFDISNTEDADQLKKANTSIDEVLTRMREISFDLMPHTLLRKGLIPAISQFVNQLDSADMKITFTAPESVTLNEYKTINLYRIMKEIIHNALKHSKASKLWLDIKVERETFIFTTIDNGVGFDIEHKFSVSNGFGLRSIINRSELMGGKITYNSVQNKGTSYIIEIPL